MDTIIKIAEEQGMKLLGGIIVIVVGIILVRWLLKLLGHSERFTKIEPTIRGFLHNLIKVVLYIIVVLTAANVMGIPLTSFVTLLGSAGVAVSLAMQGALSNLVGGLTLLLLTVDNRHVSLPNSSLTNTAIVNYSREGTRRLDVTFGVSYDADIDHTVKTLREAVSMTNGILEQPEPLIRLNECGDSSLSFLIRVWCKSADYLDVNWDLIENGKRLLDREKIEIPYPQMDVHMR